MNTLEEFEKRLSNLLDFVDENSDELIHKHNLGLCLNCLYTKDGSPYITGAAIGKSFDISIAICSFLKKKHEHIELFEKTIEIAKRSQSMTGQKELN